MTYFDRSVGLLNAGRVPDAPRRRTAVLRFGLYGAFREAMMAGGVGRCDGGSVAQVREAWRRWPDWKRSA